MSVIESIGSSTRIEGSKLSDREVGQLLSNLEIKPFATRDEQEVAGYADLMDLALSSWQDIPSPPRTTSSNCTRSCCATARRTLGRTESPNWQPWLVYFLRSLAEQVGRLEKKVEREKIVLAAMPDLQLQIVEFAREHGRVTIGEAIKLTGASRNALKQYFRALGVAAGFSLEFAAARSASIAYFLCRGRAE